MRDTKLIDAYIAKETKDKKEKELFKVLKKEVETGANGTQEYVIKQGPNKDKIAK
jgi:translation initiation factor 1 (eIF-1/SUI1)